MMHHTVLLDAVSPVVLLIPFVVLLAVVAAATFGILCLIAYIRKRNADK